MAEIIDRVQVVAAFERVTARMIELRETLNQLDAAMGDGDTGISVAKGAAALQSSIASNKPGDDLGLFFTNLGMTFNKAAPSTMGTLIATALLRAGKEARGTTTLDGSTLARMFRAADIGIQERGKAKPGDKTIVDALHPAAEAFATSIEQGNSLSEAATTMLTAARAGRDAAIPLRSKIGRASWVGERTENQLDPGTVLFVQMLEALLYLPASP